MSLRARFALVLMIAVLIVVILASIITMHLVRRPSDARVSEVVAEKVQIARLLFQEDPGAAERLGLEIGPAPDYNSIDIARTASVRDLLRERGQGEETSVFWRTEQDGERTTHVAVPMQDGRFAYLGIPRRDTFASIPLLAYLALVAIGVSVVAHYAGIIVMRPLRLLEDTVSRVGADGMLPNLAEKGPAEVRATAAVINRLSARLNSAIAGRMRMAAAAAHDMRTPMTRMRLRLEFLPDAEERAAWSADLDELEHMADSAVRLVREEVGAAGAGPVRLDLVVAEIIQEMRETELRIALAGVLPRAEIAGTPLALKRALRNLFVNAATHGAGATVTLKIMDGKVVLKIVDCGPGIPVELLTRVFEPFFRVDQARRQTVPGAGLGLAIAREIIEKHGGTISIWNRDGGGLEQTVTLPLRG
ncbi:Signal transduction histidine kinase [Rhizobium sp. RU20A]|uniref:ATP-binding protein n=1 Tax=Rhizobium sp. RU20A TaxID=1907412 RepID=UPI0009549410|nr:ATP-binding protein [Rhizobium sp. RU20A]SIQ99271.1 Signal transduction histidine kinase [Rhizobium sp. RU20A]